MKAGNFEAAWQISDKQLLARSFHSPSLPRHLQSIWDGSSLRQKRVLVRCYHGLGDTIQFIRYAPLLKALGSEVIVWAQPELIPLLQTMAGIDKLLPMHQGAPEVSFDVDIEVMELPFAFRTTLASVPRTVPYLNVCKEAIARDKRRQVGLVWSVGDWDRLRSMSFSLLTSLATIADVDWHLLQKLDELEEATFGMRPERDGILNLAETMCSLDLLITIDSMPAHLGGAMGVPVWTLLQRDADWRWMSEREDSVWYPTMRLFRQQHQGDWEGVIADVRYALACRDQTSRPPSIRLDQ